MKKFITLLLGCSLALATGVRAETPEEAAKNKKSKPVQKQQFVPKQQHIAPKTHVQTMPKQYNNPTLQNKAKMHDNDLSPNNNSTLQNKAKMHDNDLSPKKQLNTLPAVQSNNGPYVKPNNAPYVKPNKFTVQPNQSVVAPNKFQVNKNVKNFQPMHQNFHATVNSSVASVQFNKNFYIKNANNWHGAHYTVFKNYHPQWHDHGWWHSHHNHVLLIGGGWYYWNSGYWYPAWGYDESAAYYPYDGPIYVGNTPKPFDQIVADVQTALQEQGLYQGEIDGLVGPLTQEALAAYQSNAGLEQTAAIDQPTLESLGLG